MNFNQTKKITALLGEMERAAPYIKSGVIRLRPADFNALIGAMADPTAQENAKARDEIVMSGYVVKRI